MLVPLILAAAASVTIVGITDTPCPPQTPPSPEFQAGRASAYSDERRTDWADICHYRADDQLLMRRPQAERDIVFMGDSITEGWGLGDPGFFRPGWINRGVSGQTTQQMLLRFPGDVLALHPRVVHIMAGTNDVAGNTGPTTLDAVEANIAAMVVLAKAAKIRVVLAAIPPSAGFTWAPALKPVPAITALNQRLKLLATREHIAFVDYGAVLATADGAMKTDLTLDGTHPAAAGYAVMAPLARAAIATAQRQGG